MSGEAMALPRPVALLRGVRERLAGVLRRLDALPVVRQQGAMDCGPACLATVCRVYGKRVSLNWVRDLARVDQAGASMGHLIRAARELGFEASPFLAVYDQLLERKLPAIVNWKGFHWVVVHRASETEVVLADPAEGLVKRTRAEFEASWTRYTIFLAPTAAVQAIPEARPTLSQFRHYLPPVRRLIGEVVLASLAVQAIALSLPLFTKFVFDQVLAREDPQWLLPCLLGMAALMAAGSLAQFLRSVLLIFVSQTLCLRLAHDFLQALLSMPLRFFEQRKTGDVLGRFQEAGKIVSFLTDTGPQTAISALVAVSYLALMLFFSVPLTLLVLAFAVLHLVNVRVVSPRLRDAFADSFQKQADADSHLVESLQGLSTVKILGLERAQRWQWDDLNTRFMNAYFRTLHYGMAAGTAGAAVNTVGDAAVLFAGAWLALDGQVSIGTLVAFLVMSRAATAALLSLVTSWDTLQETLNAVERINDVLESTPELPADDERIRTRVPRVRGAVEFDDVTFRYYQDSPQNVLQNLAFKVEPGQRIGIVGRSGSGKSTLVKLLFGFYPPTAGRIFVDGFDLRDVWLPSLRERIGLVPQESFLFHGTVRENIEAGHAGARLRDVQAAARHAGAEEFILGLPRQYDTMLQDRGRNLSGGQRQRLCLARAFLTRPRILVLDEATSALDSETERTVQRSIEEVFSASTVFLIAHRLSTVQTADQILVLEQGHLVESGTHEALRARRGLYHHLCSQQLDV